MIPAKSLVLFFAATAAAFAPKLSTTRDTAFPLAVWKGGFKDSNPDYDYSKALSPDLSNLPITGNLDNIDKITRMQKVYWPQFSWQSVPGDESSRLYQMFAQDISRIGYDDAGRIWSIICPQRGFGCDLLGTLMLEVTVTGVRGWVDEDEPSPAVYANLGVSGVVWFESPANKNPLLDAIEKAFDKKKFPFSKANAIKVNGHLPGKPYEDYFPLVNGTDSKFFHPTFAQHWDEAYSVASLEVEIGKQEMTGDKLVDEFNTSILKIFNIVSGNILTEGQKVAWNIWFNEPEVVDQAEWKEHAEKWLHSICVEHEYPDGDGGEMTHFDGKPFEPLEGTATKMKILKDFLNANSDLVKAHEKPGILSFLKDHLFDKKTTHMKKNKCK